MFILIVELPRNRKTLAIKSDLNMNSVLDLFLQHLLQGIFG